MEDIKQMVLDFDKDGKLESICIHRRSEGEPTILLFNPATWRPTVEDLFKGTKIPLPESLYNPKPKTG